MALGQSIGLQVADAEVLTVGEQQVLLVCCYDHWSGDDGRWLRLHQEDVCQALGVPPELNYQNGGGPDVQACFGLLRQVTRPSTPQVIRLVDAVVLNALISNNDSHAKNSSLLYDGSQPTLAPLYDLLCTAVHQTPTAKMAMKIGSKHRFYAVHLRHWDRFAETARLSQAQTRKRVVRMEDFLPATAGCLQAEDPYRDDALVDRIIELIHQRCVLRATVQLWLNGVISFHGLRLRQPQQPLRQRCTRCLIADGAGGRPLAAA